MLCLKQKHNINQLDLKNSTSALTFISPTPNLNIQTTAVIAPSLQPLQPHFDKSSLDVETKPRANHQSVVSVVQTTNQTGILNTLNNSTQLDPGRQTTIVIAPKTTWSFSRPEKEESLDYKLDQLSVTSHTKVHQTPTTT